jgi:hypothetical protein
VLDFLGDIGGFFGALDLIFFMIGEYFSSRIFIGSISAFLYVLKSENHENKKGD